MMGAITASSSPNDVSIRTLTWGWELLIRRQASMPLIIDGCAWETEEADGWEALNIAFSVFNESGDQLFANYQVQKSGNGLAELGELASATALADGQTASLTIQTTEFHAGTKDLELMVSIDGFQDRAHYTIPLDRCSDPSAPGDAQERDIVDNYI